MFSNESEVKDARFGVMFDPFQEHLDERVPVARVLDSFDVRIRMKASMNGVLELSGSETVDDAKVDADA
jgi:hypothetical protein